MKLAQKPDVITQKAARVIAGKASNRRGRTGREPISRRRTPVGRPSTHSLRECAQDAALFWMTSAKIPLPERAQWVQEASVKSVFYRWRDRARAGNLSPS